MTADRARVRVLRALAYEEYLQTPEWLETRSRIRLRDRYRCVQCSSTVNCEVHHLTYARLGCELDGDLVTLCAACHAVTHRGPEFEKEVGWKREVRDPQDTYPPKPCRSCEETTVLRCGCGAVICHRCECPRCEGEL
jgi:hypothetical protein